MFVELKENEITEWNSISEEEKNKYMNEGRVQFAVDVEIKISNSKRPLSDHKYYQIASLGNTRLMNSIKVLKVTEKETTISMETSTDSTSTQVFTISTGKELTVEVGNEPNKKIYTIGISNPRLGMIVEL